MDAAFEVRRKQYTEEGFLDIWGVAAKVGTLKYTMPDGSTRIELVTPESLASSEESLKSAPVTLEHPPNGRVDASNARYLGRGHVVDARFDAPSGELRVHLRLEDKDAIERVEAGDKNELSPGYDVVLDETPGEHEEYGRYDARQIERENNHLALTGAARGGSDTALKLDSKAMEELEKILKRLDSLEAKLDAYDPEKMDAVIDALKEMREDMSDKEPKEDEGDESREDAMSREDAIRFANERSKIMAVADRLDLDIKEDADNVDLKRAIVKSQRPENERVDSASADYVDGLFDEIAVSLESDSEPDSTKDPFVSASISNRNKREDSRDGNDRPGVNPNKAFFSYKGQ